MESLHFQESSERLMDNFLLPYHSYTSQSHWNQYQFVKSQHIQLTSFITIISVLSSNNIIIRMQNQLIDDANQIKIKNFKIDKKSREYKLNLISYLIYLLVDIDCDAKKYYNKAQQMKNFKSALGKQDPVELNPNNIAASSIRTLRANNSESLWIGEGSDDQDNFAPNSKNRLGEQIIERIQNSIIEQRKIDQSTVFAIIGFYEKINGKVHKQKLILENLQIIVKRLLAKSSSELETYLVKLSELIKLRMKKLRKRQQKVSMEYDQIAQKMFKKPKDQRKLKQNRKKVLQINLQSDFQPRKTRKINKHHDSNGNSNGTKNSGSGSQDSGDAKLGKLLTSGSYEGNNNQKRKQDDNQYQQEGYSFSAIMSGSIAVKQRGAPQKKIQTSSIKSTKKGNSNLEDDNDQAFIFYRPTKPGRK